jgi:NAD(P)-dependent dehydrogenase (short-subunit alcohol dehydrogenase family)
LLICSDLLNLKVSFRQIYLLLDFMSRVTLITGANKGIGFESARQLGSRGYKILLGARDSEKGEAAAEILVTEGLDVSFVEINPCDPGLVVMAVAEVESAHGLLDVLINNAGFFSPDDGADLTAVSTKTFRETYEINVFGLHTVSRAFWPLLNKSEAARLVNVSNALGS